MTPQQLAELAPQSRSQALMLAPLLTGAMVEFGINSVKRQRAFLANAAHESGYFTRTEENLNYSAAGLANTWPARYGKKDARGRYVLTLDRRIAPNALAMSLQRKPELIANHVYAGRGGNGDEASGDGWRFRGAGFIQLTMRDNHADCAAHFGLPVEEVGAWLRTAEGAARSAAWFWSVNDCDRFADAGDFDGVCDQINRGRKTAIIGDAIGFDDRKAAFAVCSRVLT